MLKYFNQSNQLLPQYKINSISTSQKTHFNQSREKSDK